MTHLIAGILTIALGCFCLGVMVERVRMRPRTAQIVLDEIEEMTKG